MFFIFFRCTSFFIIQYLNSCFCCFPPSFLLQFSVSSFSLSVYYYFFSSILCSIFPTLIFFLSLSLFWLRLIPLRKIYILLIIPFICFFFLTPFSLLPFIFHFSYSTLISNSHHSLHSWHNMIDDPNTYGDMYTMYCWFHFYQLGGALHPISFSFLTVMVLILQ